MKADYKTWLWDAAFGRQLEKGCDVFPPLMGIDQSSGRICMMTAAMCKIAFENLIKRGIESACLLMKVPTPL